MFSKPSDHNLTGFQIVVLFLQASLNVLHIFRTFWLHSRWYVNWVTVKVCLICNLNIWCSFQLQFESWAFWYNLKYSDYFWGTIQVALHLRILSEASKRISNRMHLECTLFKTPSGIWAAVQQQLHWFWSRFKLFWLFWIQVLASYSKCIWFSFWMRYTWIVQQIFWVYSKQIHVIPLTFFYKLSTFWNSCPYMYCGLNF